MTAPGSVEASVQVAATPEVTFGYLTDPARYIQWMGSHASLDPVPGGTYRVQMADGFAAAGTFTDIDPPRRLAFTWGWADDEAARHVLDGPAAADSQALPRGSTRVVITLNDEDGGTRLTLHHRPGHQRPRPSPPGRLGNLPESAPHPCRRRRPRPRPPPLARAAGTTGRAAQAVFITARTAGWPARLPGARPRPASTSHSRAHRAIDRTASWPPEPGSQPQRCRRTNGDSPTGT
jgi:uncharacterized protein YndB with AHSA1/START domain